MNEISSFISTVGFPISITCGLLFIIYQLLKFFIEKILKVIVEKIIVAFDTITHTNEELVKTNSVLVSKIENKIDIVIEKLDKEGV